jgi:hypothetical protein
MGREDALPPQCNPEASTARPHAHPHPRRGQDSEVSGCSERSIGRRPRMAQLREPHIPAAGVGAPPRPRSPQGGALPCTSSRTPLSSMVELQGRGRKGAGWQRGCLLLVKGSVGAGTLGARERCRGKARPASCQLCRASQVAMRRLRAERAALSCSGGSDPAGPRRQQGWAGRRQRQAHF